MKLTEIVEPTVDLAQVEKFLSGSSRNEWLKVGKMKVYVRKAGHLIDGNVVMTLDLANLEQHEKLRGKGQFRQLVIDLKKKLETSPALRKDLKGIYVVLNPRLEASLPKMGFKLVARSNPPSFYLPLSL
jgi:hypothetical protein